ncbi:MAG: hypothetical protein C4325_08105 [Blastocatellia bacterium]
MAQLIIKNSDGFPEAIPLSRLRTTIGRSARSDVCLPDAFASRLHAEIRKEGDTYWLQDLGSANGTRYNGTIVKTAVPLSDGDLIQIGETQIIFNSEKRSLSTGSTLITDSTEALDPSKTISLNLRKSPTTEFFDGQFSSRADLLQLISKVGVTLLSARGLDETLDQVASLVFESVPAERCIVMLRDSESADRMRLMVARKRGTEQPIEEVRISRTVLDEVLNHGKSVLTADAQRDPRYFSQTMALQGIRSVLAVPLSVDEREIFGIIYADSPTDKVTFTEEHLNILTTLASVASIRVENARLTEERLIRERMERELELASEIQHRFQPSAPPFVPGYQFQGISFSCYEIGGDYYDFVRREDGTLLIALGDVSGKGTAAALLMSSLHAAIHAQVAAGTSLEKAVISVNRYLTENTPTNRFVTLFAAELHPDSGKLLYINAGHNPAILCHLEGGIELLSSGGLPIGLMETAEYDLAATQLEPGDLLVIYSDGVTEATNVAGEEFGLDRLVDVVSKSISLSAAAVRDKIESSLSEFSGSAPANDDITLVIVKRD